MISQLGEYVAVTTLPADDDTVGVFIGGGILRRLKRGRPDTWLYRQLQWRIATRHPLMAGWVGGHVLISRSGFWSTRRSVARGAR